MSKHNLSQATNLYFGAGFFGPMHGTNERNGVPIDLLTRINLGSPIAADVDKIVDAATSTELPDTTTVTWTTADDGSSPFDNADTPAPADVVVADGSTQNVWTLDVPRNISVNTTHASSIVAMTVTITGYDAWGELLQETITVAATGTDETDAGKKAFKHIKSIAVTSAGDATTNTLNVGTGDVLGLPYKLTAKADCIRVFFNDVLDDSATVVAADATTPSATTGDVRGTVDPNSALDGSAVVAWIYVQDPSTKAGLKGLDQYGG